MNKRLIIYCTTSICIGICIYTLQRFAINVPKIINNYLNDFLIVPIVLFLSLVVLRYTRKNAQFTLSIPLILYVCVSYSVLFEFIFPNYLARYTKDYIDVILYFAGGFIFYKLQNKSN
jgi:hypothetical protein